ncbi:MAG: response regulator [Bacillota bacterium]
MNETDNNVAIVLLVEDNPGDVLLIQEVLGGNNGHFDLHVVKDGAEAMLYLKSVLAESGKSKLPNMIILDLNLPRKNGREVLANIRSDENLRDLPVIIFTSSDAEEDILICQHLNVVKYYKKPIDFDEYVSTIKAIEGSIIALVNSKGPASN